MELEAMRARRQRIFDIAVNGLKCWREDAGDRCLVEFQHHLATEDYPGSFVRVLEKYIGGARAAQEELEINDVLA